VFGSAEALQGQHSNSIEKWTSIFPHGTICGMTVGFTRFLVQIAWYDNNRCVYTSPG
jgi:hypothetical protein